MRVFFVVLLLFSFACEGSGEITSDSSFSYLDGGGDLPNKTRRIDVSIRDTSKDVSSQSDLIEDMGTDFPTSLSHEEQIELIKVRLIEAILTTGSVALSTAHSEFKTMKFRTEGNDVKMGRAYTAKELYLCKDLKDVDHFILALAKDWYQHRSDPNGKNIENRDKVILALGWFATKIGRDEGEVSYQHYYLDPNTGERTKRNVSTYIYGVRKIQKAALLFRDFLDEKQVDEVRSTLFYDVLLGELFKPKSKAFHPFYSTDHIYNNSVALLGVLLWWLEDTSEVYASLKIYRNYLNSFLEPTPAHLDGLKPDGLGFHHGFQYNAYMYAFSVLSKQLYLLRGTDFQTDKVHYTFFRDALYGFSLMSNTMDELGSLGGRHPLILSLPISKEAYYKMALLSEEILKDDGDSLLASLHNRLWPKDPIADVEAEKFSSGFWQFNYGALGIYRQAIEGSANQGWLVGIKGFNYSMAGNEVSPPSSGRNMYGRYQNYGTVEILYPNGRVDSGAQLEGWNWNHWPGTTSIVLPWDKLKAGNLNCRWGLNERTYSTFAGALRFNSKHNALPKIGGEMGFFAMGYDGARKLNERCGHSDKQFRDSHDLSFRFRKSVFAVDGKVILLGSNIYNETLDVPTVTTIFQTKLKNKTDAIEINGISDHGFPSEHDLENGAGQWFMDVNGTGYYVQEANKIHLQKASQVSPSRTGDGTLTTDDFALAWIDHGMGPKEASYEYLIIPATTPSAMNDFSATFKSKPFYEVLRKDKGAHILRFPDKKITAYALFEKTNSVKVGLLSQTDMPILLMLQEGDKKISLTLVNPDLDFLYKEKDYSRSLFSRMVHIRLKGYWKLHKTSPSSVKIKRIGSESILEFQTHHGLPIDIVLEPQN